MNRHNISRRRLFMFCAVSASAVAVSGCITLLPNVDPVQLYRFGFNGKLLGGEKPSAEAGSASDTALDTALATSPAEAPIEIYISGINLPTAAAGDGILTTEGGLVSYIESARWASPADNLFESAVSEGFDRLGTTIRLSDRGRGAAKYRLDVQVRRFETAYVKKKPTVVVALDMTLVRLSTRMAVGHKYISREVKVDDNKVTDIVPSYELAVTQIISDMVTFTETTVKTN